MTYWKTLPVILVSLASLLCSTPCFSAGGDDANLFECPFFVLKTNLLSDCLLAPNGELELPLGKRVSVAAGLTAPWWLARDGRYCYELIAGGAEMRLWPGNHQSRPALSGWFVSLYCDSGKYDFQNRHSGAQGVFLTAGAGAGYAWCFRYGMGLEVEFGIGYMNARYDGYVPREDYTVLSWRKTVESSCVCPTRAKLSFVYRIGRRR